MGLFDRFFKRVEPNQIDLYSFAIGRAEVADNELGRGIAIRPADGRIYAPCDGNVELMFDTSHALSMFSKDGLEIFIHVGIDTMALRGEGFKAVRNTDEEVKKGDVLLEFDTNLLSSRGYDTLTSMVIMNEEEFGFLKLNSGKDVTLSDVIIETRKL